MHGRSPGLNGGGVLKWAITGVLALHLVIAMTCCVTTDLDLDRGQLRRFLNDVVDFYEWVGCGDMLIGILILTVGLSIISWWTWKKVKAQGAE